MSTYRYKQFEGTLAELAEVLADKPVEMDDLWAKHKAIGL